MNEAHPTYAGGRRLLVLACLTLLAGLFLTTPATGQSRSYWVESFDADLVVDPDGILWVTERLTFTFDGSFQGIYRDVPYRYHTPSGLDYRIRVELLDVVDGDGAELRYETSRQDGDLRFKVWVPGAENATRTVVLRYRVERALRFPEAEEGFDAHDQLYWNVTGDRWSVPIRSASARVTLPEAITAPPFTTAYSGPYGRGEGEVDIENLGRNQVRFRTREVLSPGEGLTIVVGWPPGAVYRPTAIDRAGDLLSDNWPLGLPLLALALMTAAFRRWGRDPSVNRSVMVLYEPPGELRPAELGTLIDEKVDLRDIVATVIDLAVRGYLRIEDESEKGWFRSTTKTSFVKLRDADDELRPWEREIYDGLFESGDRVRIKDLKTRFYTRVGPIKSALYGTLTDTGLFRARPDHVRIFWFVLAGVLTVAAIVLGAIFQKLAFFIAAPLVGLVVAAFAPFMPARTSAGRTRFLELKGFEEFLGRTDAERFRALGLAETAFEKYLPYAMAFGVADHWAALFEGLLAEPPDWYVGPPGTFHPALFHQRMDGMVGKLGSAMVTAPRSSSSGSSGFSSGGGFSGGGFGGGGGGAF